MNKPASPGKGKPSATTEIKAPKVSIVIPAYNREQYVGIAIKSVLDQTYRDLELIIVDDGSTDATLAISQQFAREDDRVRVLSDKINRGAAYALKTGFEAARGEYVGQVDSDDLLEARAIELTAAVLDEHLECGMVYTNYMEINKDGRVLRPGRRCAIPYSKERLLIDFMTFHFRLIRKSTYNFVGGFDIRFDKIEDYDLCLRLSEITQIKKVEKLLYQYRLHSKSISRTKGLKVIMLVKEGIEEALKRRTLDKKYRVNMDFNPTYWLEEIKSDQPAP